MKPFIIYVDVNADKITLSKEEFEKFLKEAYEQGHNEGYNKGLACNRSNWWNYPQITTTASSPKPNPITITCDNDRNSIIKSGHVGD